MRFVATEVVRVVVRPCVACMLGTLASPTKPTNRDAARKRRFLVHVGATWRIRLNDPSAAATGLVSSYFDHTSKQVEV